MFYFKKLNKVHHETAHDRRHARDPYSFTDRSDSSSFNHENFIKEYHVYIKVWSTLLGECLFGKKEQSNGVEKNAVAVIHLNSSGKKGVVSYVPQNISGVVSLYFSRPHCYLEKCVFAPVTFFFLFSLISKEGELYDTRANENFISLSRTSGSGHFVFRSP